MIFNYIVSRSRRRSRTSGHVSRSVPGDGWERPAHPPEPPGRYGRNAFAVDATGATALQLMAARRWPRGGRGSSRHVPVDNAYNRVEDIFRTPLSSFLPRHAGGRRSSSGRRDVSRRGGFRHANPYLSSRAAGSFADGRERPQLHRGLGRPHVDAGALERLPTSLAGAVANPSGRLRSRSLGARLSRHLPRDAPPRSGFMRAGRSGIRALPGVHVEPRFGTPRRSPGTISSPTRSPRNGGVEEASTVGTVGRPCSMAAASRAGGGSGERSFSASRGHEEEAAAARRLRSGRPIRQHDGHFATDERRPARSRDRPPRPGPGIPFEAGVRAVLCQQSGPGSVDAFMPLAPPTATTSHPEGRLATLPAPEALAHATSGRGAPPCARADHQRARGRGPNGEVRPTRRPAEGHRRSAALRGRAMDGAVLCAACAQRSLRFPTADRRLSPRARRRGTARDAGEVGPWRRFVRSLVRGGASLARRAR